LKSGHLGNRTNRGRSPRRGQCADSSIHWLYSKLTVSG